MKNIIITINEKGLFQDINSPYYIDIFDFDRFEVNGWTGTISGRGIYLEASGRYNDGVHWISGEISNGLLTVRHKHGTYGNIHTDKRIRVCDKRESPIGSLILGGGNIDDRYIAFRSEEFNKFLKRHGINKVSHAEPPSVLGSNEFRIDGDNWTIIYTSDSPVGIVSYATLYTKIGDATSLDDELPILNR